MSDQAGSRIKIAGAVASMSLREDVRSRARDLGLLGWVRLEPDGSLCVHAEGDRAAIEELIASLRSLPGVESVSERKVKAEGHEQFAIRGVPAGVFVVQEHQATAHHFDVRLEVDGVMRSWAVPKGPSLDPTVKRFAVQVEDHTLAHNDFEGRSGRGGVIIWDRGQYEQGGRVPWPEALERGHAVFVLHGEKLQGGFALQRTRGGDKPQWLLIKRRDEYAQPGSDIAAERPESVQSGVSLQQLLDEGL
ncbi:MAG TPA: DNA polymerase ligase N-terminal domain-containing protein [Solirubrobacteraceae bacterium]|nr:DNA polymerase ligase N-terminal domain-containing protein [Solirubrobacteraceae bacterium]